MATGKVIGKIEVSSIGNVVIVGADGVVRDAAYGGLMYQGEQLVSNDPETLFQIKYLALPEATVYEGVFGVLTDGSVIADASELETLFGDDIDFMETAAGGGEADANSGIPEDAGIFADSSVQDFYRGENGEVGLGITNFGSTQEGGDQTPPIITSTNVVVFDENSEESVLMVTASDPSSPLTFTLENGYDSAFFSIDPVTGVLTFNSPPDYETPLDMGNNNEYNIEVTVTDAFGNYTTQFISVSINNLNDNVPTADDGENSATEDVIDEITGHSATGQLVGDDADGNEIEFELVTDVPEGSLVLNSDGSYTFSVEGDFQDLAIGETREITFTYKTVEVGPPLSEPSDAGPWESEVATVTITVTGTNDQPVVSDINANSEDVTFWNLVAEGADLQTIEALAEMGISNTGSYPTDGSAIKFTVEADAGESVSFNWDFFDAETPAGYSVNDFSFVVVDGVLMTLEDVLDTDVNGNTVFSHIFTTVGSHTVTFGVMNSGDTIIDSALNVEHISGGTVVDIEYVGNVSENVISNVTTFYESTSSGDPLVDIDQSDVLTLFEGNLATAVDADVSDTHTYHMLEGSVTVDGIPTQNIVVGQLGGETLGLDNWGVELDGHTREMTLDNGMTITTSSDSKVLRQYDHNANHVGEGIGDKDGSGINAGETITVTFDGGFVMGATFGFDGLGGHFQEGSVDAKATWTAYNNDVEVASGEVQRDGDNFVEINSDIPFDTVVFGTDSPTGSNWELRYVNAEVIPVDVIVDADGEYDVVGNFNYLNVGDTAVVTFQYYADDQQGFGTTGDGGANEASLSEPKTVTLTITGTNDVPVAVADSGTTTENVAVTIDVLANDTDVDNGAVLSLDAVSVDEGSGSVSIIGNELFFDPGTNFDYLAVGESVDVEVSYTMSDEHGAESNSTATITVTGTNDAPIISESDVLFVSEAAGYNNVLVAYILDGDGNPTNPVIAVMDTNSGHATGSLMSSLDMPAGDIHFALIANGQTAYPGIADAVLSFDTSGAFPQLLIDGSVSTKPVYFDQNNFNPDGKDHFDSVDNGDGTITINMEDLNLGDNDRQDLVITLVDNTVGDVKELVDGHEFENIAALTATGALSFDDADLNDTHTVSATPNEAGYLGTLTADINPAATGPDAGQINWNYSVNDADVNHLAEGETLTQVYTITVDDGNGGTDTQEVTITIEGTNDAPIASGDSITKVVDHVEHITMDDITTSVWAPGCCQSVSHQNNGWFGVNDHLLDQDNNNLVDSKGGHNDVVRMSTDILVDNIEIEFRNIDPNDNIHVEVWNSGAWNVVHSGALDGSGQVSLNINPGYDFSRIRISALDTDQGNTEFRINQVVEATEVTEVDTIVPFVIDDAMLLANDIDDDGDVLSVSAVDGTLYLGGTMMSVGTVSIDHNGDIEVTPNQMYEISSDIDNIARFEYTIDDGNGGTASADAYINLSTHEVSGDYVVGATEASTLVVTGSDTLDLSNISGLDAVVLETDANVDQISIADVMNATDGDNTLIIRSYDGNAYDQVDVHDSFGDASAVVVDGQDYAQYTDGTATLLIEIDDPIDIV